MTTFNYAAVAADALAMLQEFGQAITLSRAGTPTYDPATAQNTQTPASASGTGALFDYTPGEQQRAGSLIRAGDKRLYLAAMTPAPRPNDKITIGSVSYTVIACETLAPAGVAVLHDVQLRQ